MLDHITFGVSDFEKSTAFYDLAFAPIGVSRLMTLPASDTGAPNMAAYGDERPWFWVAEHDATKGKLHIAVRVDSRALVDDFYTAAIAAGGQDNGTPGVRPHYHPNYYGAFVLDPDGHNIEAVCHTPE